MLCDTIIISIVWASVAPSNVKMPLYLKRQLNVKKISTLNVKIEVICEKLTLNVKTLGSLNV